MKNKFTLLLICLYQLSFAQLPTKLWEPISESVARRVGEKMITPEKYKIFQLSTTNMRDMLATAPSEKTTALKNSTTIIELPMPDGTLKKYRIVVSPVMEVQPGAPTPTIQTYNAMGIDQLGTYGKLDYSESNGFHGTLSGPFGRVMIDPYSLNNTTDYLCYYAADVIGSNAEICTMTEAADATLRPMKPDNIICAGSTLRTYRLAMACTGEFAMALNGGTIPSPTSLNNQIVSLVARLNDIYEKEAAIRFVLVPTNQAVLFTDPATDPFNGNNNVSMLLTESQHVIDSIIGDANYDIGHTLGGANLGGQALTFEIACVQGKKASAVSCSSSPLNLHFTPLVAHELGHQFGCRHTFNRCTNYPAAVTPNNTVEPGGGLTIMGYPGVCGPSDDIASGRISYFHAFSLDQLMTYTNQGNGNTCATPIASGNKPPVIDNLPNYTIPKSTPFELTGKATDPDGDVLAYSWEEMDINNTPHNLGAAAPYFKSYEPQNTATRIFPPLANVVSQTTATGEYLPATAQTLNFRFTARDGKIGGGGVCAKNMQLTIAPSGPFVITSQNTPVTWNACKTETITWDVAGTNQAPVHTTMVNVLYSVDGGVTFIPLLSDVPNNGTCNVTVPSVATTNGRIMIKSVGNVFFAVNTADITITGLCADFEASSNGVIKTNIEQGQALIYKDLSVGNPTSWNWIFEGGTPATATGQNPTVTYNVPGSFKVELRIANGTAKDSIIRKNYVTVGATYNKGQAYTCIAIDSAGNLWSGTNKKGVFLLDKKTNPAATQFSVLPFSGNFDPTNFAIQSIACDSLGNTWVAHGGAGNTTGTSGGMERIDYNNPSTIQHYTPTSQTRCLKLGENDGLASRNIQCVVVDKNNTVWSAHRYHDLTVSPDYYVTPGSFSYKTSTASMFTSKSSWTDRQNGLEPPELPYPAYTCNAPGNKTPQTRTCNAIACGKDEMWVSVYPYESIDGAVFPARILRYDLNGQFIGPTIDFKTIGIPAGGVFNGIYISPKGDAWVTVSAGKGFAVRIEGSWKFISPNDMPCIFPAGATINQNAIWGNKFGNVFIGTSKGLIVYNGDGNVSSAASYSFYALAKDAGGNRSVAGGVSEQDSIQWIATDDGIVRTVIGRYDMTASDVDYTSCNNADMNAVESAIKSGENNKSYHDYPITTIICDKKTSKYPDRCNAEFVYGMIKNDATLTSPIPADYPTNILDMFTNEHNILFSLVAQGPFLSAIASLTNEGLTAEQNSFNASTSISCKPYRLYGNIQSVLMHILYDSGPSHKYFRDCNWLWMLGTPAPIAWDFSNSMDDYCGNQLLNTKYDPIVLFVNDKKKMITNYTEKGHILYPGKVERTIIEECGVVKVVTRGIGLQYCGDNCRGALMGQANIKLGTFLFTSVDRRLKAAFEK